MFHWGPKPLGGHVTGLLRKGEKKGVEFLLLQCQFCNLKIFNISYNHPKRALHNTSKKNFVFFFFQLGVLFPTIGCMQGPGLSPRYQHPGIHCTWIESERSIYGHCMEITLAQLLNSKAGSHLKKSGYFSISRPSVDLDGKCKHNVSSHVHVQYNCFDC